MEEFNQKIRNLWENKDYKDLAKGIPLQFPEFNENPDILFIGINPSHRKKSKELRNYSESLEDEKKAKNNKRDQYFKLFYEFTNNWEHIDLFFIRGDQGELKKHVVEREEKEKIKINEFGEEQLKISFSMIDEINPKVIVVNNALASKIIKNKFSIPNKVDEDTGYNILKGIPIFFSGMLSGRRALDKGSFSRLIWHVKKTLNFV